MIPQSTNAQMAGPVLIRLNAGGPVPPLPSSGAAAPSTAGAVPVPNPNVAQSAVAFAGGGASAQPRVQVLNAPPLLQGSSIPTSAGDEAGSAGGAGFVSNHLQARGLTAHGANRLSNGMMPTAPNDLLRLRMPGVSTARLMVGW